MIKENVTKFLFEHPFYLDTAKLLISNKYLINSKIYQNFVLKKAKKLSDNYQPVKDCIYVETTLNCNARCVFCYHHEKVMIGTMTMDLFKKIINDCHANDVNHIILSVYGEFTIDPFMWQRVEYLRSLNMSYGFITNAFRLTPQVTDRLFSMGGIKYVNFSANGYDPKIYEEMMQGLKRDQSYNNILYFLKQKAKHQEKDLVVTISTVKNSFNAKDFNDFFKFWSKQPGVNQILPIELRSNQGEKEYDGKLGPLGPLHQKGLWLAPCRQLWGAVFILFDGRVIPCCDELDQRRFDIGNLKTETLREIWNGPKIKALRKIHLNDLRKNHPICSKCLHNSIWFN